MAPLVGYLSQYRWTVETSFTGQDLHQEVCLDVLGFHAWFKKRLWISMIILQKVMLINCARTLGVLNLRQDYPSITNSVVAQSNIGNRFWRWFAFWAHNLR